MSESKPRVFRAALITTALVVAEAVGLFWIGSTIWGPQEVLAIDQVATEEIALDRSVEVPVFDGVLSNDRLGTAFFYRTEIHVQVLEADQVAVADLLDRNRNQIRADINAAWRAADPAWLQEPRMETLTRRIESLLREHFDGGSTAGSESVIRKCILLSGTGIRGKA